MGDFCHYWGEPFTVTKITFLAVGPAKKFKKCLYCNKIVACLEVEE